MKKLLIAALLIAILLTAVAAARPRDNAAATVWANVMVKGGPCPGLAHYISPCPECKVWLRWHVPVPTCLPDPVRLTGYITDEPGGCQVLNVTSVVCCEP